MKTIYHKDLQPYLTKIQNEPEFQCGSRYNPTGQEWYRKEVLLEFPMGEIAKDFLTTIALVGRSPYNSAPIGKNDRFNAQGLEGKVQVKKDFFAALMNMRDLLPENRGRIVLT